MIRCLASINRNLPLHRPISSFNTTPPPNSKTSTLFDTPRKKHLTKSELPDPPATLVKCSRLITTAESAGSRPAPSMFALHGLRTLPFWTSPNAKAGEKEGPRVAYNDQNISEMIRHIESKTGDIREEYLAAVMGIGDDMVGKKPLEGDYDAGGAGGEHPDSLHTGNWEWHSYILKGARSPTFASRCPKTASLLDDLGPQLFSTPFSFAFFSTLHSGSIIKPHHGPMNLRLRVHLPIIVPKECADVKKVGIRVGQQKRTWEVGKAVVLDDTFEHEVWNHTDEPRVVLLFDIWHPDVTKGERESVNEMFSFAHKKGWMGN